MASRYRARPGPAWPAVVAGQAATLGLGAAISGLPHRALIAVGIGSAALGAFAVCWQLRRRHLLRARGTVYVVRERATGTWAEDETSVQRFTAALRRDFPTVRLVPGPRMLHDWRWPPDATADQWDTRVDHLVTALRIVREGDDDVPLPGLVLWGWWPVAIALTARLLDAERARPLGVRQRITHGRETAIDSIDPAQPALTFVRSAPQPFVGRITSPSRSSPARRALGLLRISRVVPEPPLLAEHYTWKAEATIQRRGRTRDARPSPADELTVLLVRMTNQAWDPLGPLDGNEPEGSDPRPLEFAIEDTAGIGVSGPVSVTIHEWRCRPPADGSGHRWQHYEPLARAATAWISEQAATGPTGTILLGTSMPQEVGAGIGILVHRMASQRWPAHLWPLVRQAPYRYVIPALDLGSAPTRRTSGG